MPSRSEIRRVTPYLTLGLMDGIIRMSIQHKATYLCATMERQLLRLLNRMGIHFEPIGPVVEYHGLRQPCYRYLLDLLNQVKKERFDVWEVMTNEGAHVEALQAIEG
jgi:N-acyl amino acid synthase of PEP-CTERM/exosortase system